MCLTVLANDASTRVVKFYAGCLLVHPQPRVPVALIQCTMATEVVEVATESEEDVVILCEEEEEGAEKRTNFIDIVGLHVRAVSVFGKKSDAVCGFFACFCTVSRFSDPLARPSIHLKI